MFEFRYRKKSLKKEINEALRKVDPELGQTLFVENANIKPDGGLIEVKINCIMCDSDLKPRDYFEKHIENMKSTDLNKPFVMNENIKDFFEEVSKRRSDNS